MPERVLSMALRGVGRKYGVVGECQGAFFLGLILSIVSLSALDLVERRDGCTLLSTFGTHAVSVQSPNCGNVTAAVVLARASKSQHWGICC